LLSQQAVAREGSAADVANVIDFFLRPESDLVTGQIVYLGGIS
jgi:3-oxoacyl-[acyl-carrier protein] reductase